MNRKIDYLIWSIAIFLVIGGIVTNYYFSNVAVAIRVACWIVLICILTFAVFKTTQGNKTWNFMKDARMELFKVFWPTRQETVQITAIIACVVVFVAIIMWIMDSSLLLAIKWFTVR